MRAAAWLMLLSLGARHPMHTSAAEVRVGADRAVALRVRLFRDDIAAAAGADPARVAAYVQQGFALLDGAGRRLPITVDGVRSDGDAVEVDAHAAPLPPGAAVRHALLQERFPDQVNVVRIVAGGATRTLLFLPGDPAKPLP